MSPSGTIGVFDSGVGGLTVVRALRARLPGESIRYLGDTARVPYGTKSPRTVERYAVNCMKFLLSHDVKLILIACNTASANALPALQAQSPVPVIGAVEPGAGAAVRASSAQSIGVLGTLATVESGAYHQAIRALAPGACIEAAACPLFVPLAEEGWGDTDIARAVALRYLQPLFERAPTIDTLVLGCTHYPLLREVIQEVSAELRGGPVAVVDSATAMAEAAAKILAEGESRGPRTEDRGPRTDDRRLTAEDRGPRTEDRGPRTEDRGPTAEDREPRTEDREPRTETDDRGPTTETEDRGPTTETEDRRRTAESSSGSASVGSLAPPQDSQGSLQIYVTDSTRLEVLAARFLGEPVPRVELVDL